MIIGGSGSGKTNALINFIEEQDDIDKIYLYAKDLSDAKHLFNVQIEWMTFIRILMITIQSEKEKILIVFDDMIADIMTSKTF